MKYIPPITKDGKIQHVPIVVKSRDMLVGYLLAYNDMLSDLNGIIDLSDKNILDKIAPQLDSSRFNGYIADGIDSSNLNEDQIQDLEEDSMDLDEEHPDNKEDILNIKFFSIDCVCGNFVSFASVKEIPTKDFKCDICDRVLIQYIEVDDDEIDE